MIQPYPSNPPPVAGAAIRCAVLLALLAVVVAALACSRPPAPRGLHTPAAEFSAVRAIGHLPSIAARAHPIGSAENARVRAYLLDRLRALGLDPHVQTAFVAKPDDWGVVAGTVHNVIVRVPGQRPGKAVVLVAHYDSVTTGPGAADNGASVAALLETLRALRAGAALRNDVIAVFSDGEEVELLGAEAFVAQHPWARQAALALNFEFRGNRGPAMLFETSAGNGRLVAQFAQSVPHPLGSSLWYELYRHMPNDTDLSVFKRAGIAGLNLAAAEGHTHYHTQLDRIDQLQPGSVQHIGENMLALARGFGDADLGDLRSGDRVFFSMPGIGMIDYDERWVAPLSALALGLMLSLLIVAGKRGLIRVAGTARAGAAFVLSVIASAGLCQTLWWLIGWLHPGYATMLQGDTYNSHWYLLAFVSLSVGWFTVAVPAAKRWFAPGEFALAAMLAWTMVLGAASVAMPGASYLLLWPLLPVQVATLIVLSRRGQRAAPAVRLLLLAAGAVPGVALFAGSLWELFVALTPTMAFAVGAAAALLLAILAPLLVAIGGEGRARWIPWLLAAVFVGIGSATSGFDRAHPRQNSLMYAQDGASGRAWWLSRDRELDEWTGRYISRTATRRAMPEFFGADSDDFWAGATPALLPVPTLRVDAEHTQAGVRTLTLRIASARRAPRLMLSVDGAAVLGARVNGVAVADTPKEAWMLDLYAPDPQGALLELRLKADTAYTIRLLDVSYDAPMMKWARPDGMVPQPFMLNGAAIVRVELVGGAG